MKNINIIVIILSLSVQIAFAQKGKTDTNIVGHVTNGKEHLSFINVYIKGTTIGTATDLTGHFQLINVPVGEMKVVASAVGYKPEEVTITTNEGETSEIKFELETDMLNLLEVVVTADRIAQNRNTASVIVNTLTTGLFRLSQSVMFSEGLNFSPGLRVENNCQNCGFTQLRMNGMEGPYTQILINSRPVFSGLAGVYGLELIPSNMIERVEIVRGGGSALYGSNAVAGTVNLILKDPLSNSYEIGASTGLTGVGVKHADSPASDYSVNFNTSMISEDQKTGLAMYGFTRDKQVFDANNDGFSEIALLNNATVGSRFFHRFGSRGKLSVDYFNIQEERAGGNKHDLPFHERDIAEAVKHKLNAGAVTYEKFFRDFDVFSVFASAQHLDRESYYGANQSLCDYGNTKDITFNFGAQYKMLFGNSTMLAGVENTGGHLHDKKLGFPDYDNAVIVDGIIENVPHIGNRTVANQSSYTAGVFTQGETTVERIKVTIGARFENYKVKDLQVDGNLKTGNVFSPRISFMYDLSDNLKVRLSYAHGYRAPQIFDEDLHIEASGSRQVININDPDLTQETSHSYITSLDFNKSFNNTSIGLLAEGFYTKLLDPFVNEIGSPDENGTVIYTRINAEDGAVVRGVNLEIKLMPSSGFAFASGFTLQQSEFEKPQEFNEKRFFRNPGSYGFFTCNGDLSKNLNISATGTYTGKMLLPYFGPLTDPDEGELKTTNPFFDLGVKVGYSIKLNGSKMQIYGGMKNIFNSYQSDFDAGINRDPSYIYGPLLPRMVYVGVRVGNMMK